MEVAMFSRIRIALGLALLMSLLTSITALAKGNFSFIAITSAKLKNEVRLSDPALTHDFFTFADYFQNKTETPVDPGVGYEITRYYINGQTETAFDRLHYYPETGFVYYDGIVNGASEYDGKWYIAKSEIKSIFETALSTRIGLMELGTQEGSQALVPPAEPIQAMAQAETRPSMPQSQSDLPIIVLGELAVLIAATFLRFRRVSVR
jgi:hypothetical protein